MNLIILIVYALCSEFTCTFCRHNHDTCSMYSSCSRSTRVPTVLLVTNNTLTCIKEWTNAWIAVIKFSLLPSSLIETELSPSWSSRFTLETSGCRSVGIVRSLTKATELVGWIYVLQPLHLYRRIYGSKRGTKRKSLSPSGIEHMNLMIEIKLSTHNGISHLCWCSRKRRHEAGWRVTIRPDSPARPHRRKVTLYVCFCSSTLCWKTAVFITGLCSL
jgi:hypothetical protein